MKKNKRQHKLKIHKLQSTWETQDKSRTIDMWRLLNNKDDHALIPLKMFKDIHTGDLMLAFRKHLIPEKQIFHIRCEINAKNDLTGEEVNVTYETSLRQRVTIWQFLEGKDSDYPEEIIYKDTGNGFDLWEGFHHELKAYLDTVGDDEYEMKSNFCTLTVHTSFKSIAHEQAFYKVKGENLAQFNLIKK